MFTESSHIIQLSISQQLPQYPKRRVINALNTSICHVSFASLEKQEICNDHYSRFLLFSSVSFAKITLFSWAQEETDIMNVNQQTWSSISLLTLTDALISDVCCFGLEANGEVHPIKEWSLGKTFPALERPFTVFSQQHDLVSLHKHMSVTRMTVHDNTDSVAQCFSILKSYPCNFQLLECLEFA